jgi:ribosome modulation factor
MSTLYGLPRQAILAGVVLSSSAMAACLCSNVARSRQAHTIDMFGMLADSWPVVRFRHAYMQGTDARFYGRSETSCPLPNSLRREAWLAGWHEEDLIQHDFNP